MQLRDSYFLFILCSCVFPALLWQCRFLMLTIYYIQVIQIFWHCIWKAAYVSNVHDFFWWVGLNLGWRVGTVNAGGTAWQGPKVSRKTEKWKELLPRKANNCWKWAGAALLGKQFLSLFSFPNLSFRWFRLQFAWFFTLILNKTTKIKIRNKMPEKIKNMFYYYSFLFLHFFINQRTRMKYQIRSWLVPTMGLHPALLR